MEDIIKYNNDYRKYYHNVLNNNIKYTIVTDKLLTESYVMIYVNSGSGNEPRGYDGLAHFLEHLIFFGSKKYPNIDLLKFISDNGGSSNAFTSLTETAYFFNILDDNLEKVIDIFSNALLDPSFSENNVKSEMNNVNSEYMRGIQDDNNIFIRFVLSLTDDFNLLAVGNNKTLSKPDIIDKIKEYHNNYYTTDNISICIVSSIDRVKIDKMINKYFSLLKKSVRKNDTYDLLNKDLIIKNINKTYYLQSISDINILVYIWNIPHKLLQFNKEFDILSDILNNNSKLSLTIYLKNLGYINSINSSVDEIGIFTIKISLTDMGLQHLETVENILFNFLDNIINYDNNEYAKYYNEKIINEFKWNSVSDIISLCETICSNSFIYNPKDLLFGKYKIDKIKSDDEYRNYFNKYISRDKLLKIISTNKFDFDSYDIFNHYNVKYCGLEHKITYNNKIKLNIDRMYEILNSNNDYFNINSKIIKISDNNNYPTLINKNIWYCGNSSFNESDICINLYYYNKKLVSTIHNYVLTLMAIRLLNAIIDIELYKIFESEFNISLSLNYKISCVIITINGLNDIEKIKNIIEKLNYLLDNIPFEIFTDIYIENSIRDIIKNLKNNIFMEPLEYSSLYLNKNMYKYYYHPLECLTEIEKIKISDIKNQMSNLLNNTVLSAFIYGNITKQDSNDIIKMFPNKLGSYKFLLNHNINKKISVKHPNKKEQSSSLFYYYECDTQEKGYDLLIITKAKLLLEIINQLFFDILRSKHQLGYIVNMSSIKIKNKYYITQKIQTEKDIKQCKILVKHFNKNIGKHINGLSDKEFNNYKYNLYKHLSKPFNTFGEQYLVYSDEIYSQEYVFDRKYKMAKYLYKINKQDIIDFSYKYINKKNRASIIIK